MIIVTGAAGLLGRAIIEQLVKRTPQHVGASVRNPTKAMGLEALGVRVRRGDFDDPSSLRHAFEGAAQVLIVSSNARAYGGDTLAQHRAAIDAAVAVGAGRIVYTSHMGASAASAFPPMLDHAATEDTLRRSGIAWTALRNGFYASSGLDLMGDALETGQIEAPADGKVAWTAHADLAEAAAAILTDEERWDGPTPPLTGSQALDLADLARIASQLQARPVRRDIIGDEEMRARMMARGAPDGAARLVLGLYVAARAGEFAHVDPTLERLLKRRPISMQDLIADRIAHL